MIPDGPTFVQPRQELQQKQSRRDSLNIWRDGRREGWHNLSYQLTPREGPGRQSDLRKGAIIGGEIGHFICARREVHRYSQHLCNLIPSTVLWLQLSQQI